MPQPPPESDLQTDASDGASDSVLSDVPEADFTETSEPLDGSPNTEAVEAGPIDDAIANQYIDELLEEIEEPEQEPEPETGADRIIPQRPPILGPRNISPNP